MNNSLEILESWYLKTSLTPVAVAVVAAGFPWEFSLILLVVKDEKMNYEIFASFI